VVAPNWATMGENEYTPLVSTLLTRLYPDVKIIDGAGGDGGRDAQRRSEGRDVVYQLKYFPGRIEKTQRAQVRRSLTAVKSSAPDEWYLVVPTELTPGEIRWFEGLKKDFSFVTTWHGEHWLNSALAAHQDILRYYSDANAEVVSAVIQLREEQSVLLGGVPQVVSRIEGLQARADEISTDWGVRLPRHIEIFPKDLARARPISFTTHLVPGDDLAEFARIQSAAQDMLDFGGRIVLSKPYLHGLTIDAPPELGIAGTTQPDAVEIGSINDDTGLPVTGTLKIVSAAGLPIQYLQTTFVRRENGRRGETLIGHGPGQLVTVRIRLVAGSDTGSIDFALDPVAFASPPASVAAALRFLTALKPGTTLLVSVAGIEGISDITQAPFAEHEQWLTVLDDLAEIQARCGYQFKVPDPLTSVHARVIDQIRRLIDGESVDHGKGPLRITVHRHKLDSFLDLVNIDGALIIMQDNVRMSIGDHDIELGPGYWATNVRLANRKKLQKLRGKPNGTDPEALFTLVGATHMKLRLGRVQTPLPPPVEIPIGSNRVLIRRSDALAPNQ